VREVAEKIALKLLHGFFRGDVAQNQRASGGGLDGRLERCTSNGKGHSTTIGADNGYCVLFTLAGQQIGEMTVIIGRDKQIVERFTSGFVTLAADDGSGCTTNEGHAVLAIERNDSIADGVDEIFGPGFFVSQPAGDAK